MTLSSAIATATSSLASTSTQVSNLSRNIAGVGDPNYVRRDSHVVTGLYGSTQVETQRNLNHSIFGASNIASADAQKSQVLSQALDKLAVLQGLGDYSRSPAGLLGSLQSATELAANTPSDPAALSSLVETARAVTGQLQSLYGEVLDMREVADKEIGDSVERINSLLSRFKEVNDEIVDGSRGGRDVFDHMDQRDRLVVEISEEIGISVIRRENNDYMLSTDNGVLLFEGSPRSVTFQPTPSYGPTTSGGVVKIDGVPINGDVASLPVRSGKIAGQLELRDTLLPTYQAQLDEVARSLVSLYSETDQSGGGKPPLTGLITWDGGPAVPPDGLLSPGIGMSIRVNSLVDPTEGGDVTKIRDGAINGDLDYLSSNVGGASFSDRLFMLAEGFDSEETFSGSTGLSGTQTRLEYAAASLDWISLQRQSAAESVTYQTELSDRFKETLQNENGPNLDFEMSRLLEVERAYQATARLLSAVDEMLLNLLQVAR